MFALRCFIGFSCEFVEETGGTETVNEQQGNYYMAADYSLKCYDERYYGRMVLAVSVVVLFSLGIPLFLFACVLRRKRRQLEESETKRLLGMLYSSYKVRTVETEAY